MENTFENKLTMYKAVLALLNEYKVITDRITAFAIVRKTFSDKVSEVVREISQVDLLTRGKAVVKADFTSVLVTSALQAVNALTAFAMDRGNIELLEQTRAAERKLKTERDTDLLSVTAIVLTLAIKYARDIAPFGFSSGKVSQLANRQDVFEAILGTKHVSIAEPTAGRTRVHHLIDEADRVLKNGIDNLIELVRASDPHFYEQYHQARKVKESTRESTYNSLPKTSQN